MLLVGTKLFTLGRWEMAFVDAVPKLNEVRDLRIYFPESLSQLHELELEIFSHASEKAISTVAYLKIKKMDCWRISFVMEKAKLAPSHGHTISQLELCAALLATQVAHIVQDNIRMRVDKVPKHGSRRHRSKSQQDTLDETK